MARLPSRLKPTPSTLKKLFAYSGNRCAMPNCKEPLVDLTGTMLGKVAHICAAEPKGPRYDPLMNDEDRRSFNNLFLVCGKHHDIIDDKANVASYPAEDLREHKRIRERRFQIAERQLLELYSDSTQASQPTYPISLARLADALDLDDVIDEPDEISGLRIFIDKLKECPLEQRGFALKLAERMRRRDVRRLSVQDAMGAFQISDRELARNMQILEEHVLGCIDEDEPGAYVVSLFERSPAGNPFVEILDFCDATGCDPDTLIYDLAFTAYDA